MSQVALRAVSYVAIQVEPGQKVHAGRNEHQADVTAGSTIYSARCRRRTIRTSRTVELPVDCHNCLTLVLTNTGPQALPGGASMDDDETTPEVEAAAPERSPAKARRITTRAEFAHLRKELVAREYTTELDNNRLAFWFGEAPDEEPMAYVEVTQLIDWAAGA